MSRKEFIKNLNDFLKSVDKLNLIKTDSSNLIYSFGGIRPSDTLSYKIREELHGLVESFKDNNPEKIIFFANNLKNFLNSSFLIGEINQLELENLVKKLEKLIKSYNGASK